MKYQNAKSNTSHSNCACLTTSSLLTTQTLPIPSCRVFHVVSSAVSADCLRHDHALSLMVSLMSSPLRNSLASRVNCPVPLIITVPELLVITIWYAKPSSPGSPFSPFSPSICFSQSAEPFTGSAAVPLSLVQSHTALLWFTWS